MRQMAYPPPGIFAYSLRATTLYAHPTSPQPPAAASDKAGRGQL